MRHVEFTFEIIAATIDPCYALDELTYQLATRYKYYPYRPPYTHTLTHTHLYTRKDNTIIDSVVSVTAI